MQDRAVSPPAGRRQVASGTMIRRPADRTMRILLFSLFLLASFYTLYFAADLFRPIAAAILLNILLSPLVRFLQRYRIPAAVSAVLIVASLIGAASTTVVALSEPAGRWLNQAPSIADEVKWKLRNVLRPVENVKKASEEVDKLTSPADTAGQQEVTVKPPSTLERIFDSLQDVGIELTIAIFLLLFLLASADMFKAKLVAIVPRFTDKKRAVAVINTVEQDAATYFLTVAAINATFGVIVGLGFYAVGLPNPVLWGAAAAGLNFIPYLGALIGISLVFVVGIITFPSLGQAAIAPMLYAALTVVEGQLVTPTILGRQLTMNAVIVFLSVVFWGWLWGIPGALMAVPFLVTLRALADNIEVLAPIAVLLRGRPKTGTTEQPAPAR